MCCEPVRRMLRCVLNMWRFVQLCCRVGQRRWVLQYVSARKRWRHWGVCALDYPVFHLGLRELSIYGCCSTMPNDANFSMTSACQFLIPKERLFCLQVVQVLEQFHSCIQTMPTHADAIQLTQLADSRKMLGKKWFKAASAAEKSDQHPDAAHAEQVTYGKKTPQGFTANPCTAPAE